MTPALIMLVEDDSELRAVIRRGLEEEGFDVVGAGSGAEATHRAAEAQPAAVIIDIGLPDADGRDLCQALRAGGLRAPVIFLTARDALTDRLSGFSAGGDDYITKPFSPAELTARVRAVLSRSGVERRQTDALGLELDATSYEIVVGSRRARLTPTEFRLLGALAAQRERPVTRRELVRAAWPDGAVVHDNTIDVYLARVRRKLRELPGAPSVKTVHGVGYRLIRASE
jgi:two-component system response regulator MprA